MNPTIRIKAVLGVVCVLLVGILFFGRQKTVHFDEVTLTQEGVVLNLDMETQQFEKDTILYRTWDDAHIIAASSGDDKRQILKNNMLFFNDQSILFNNEALIINTDGLTAPVTAKEAYTLSQKTYQSGESSIDENSIVKLADRTYYVNATATVYVGEQEMGQVENPLLLIDKTGSVTVYEAPQKKRYLGHLTLKIDDTKQLDVSDEMYYIGERKIDLASFGGTDNEKKVVAKLTESKKDTSETSSQEKESTESSKSFERNYSSSEKETTGATSEASTAQNGNNSQTNANGGTDANANTDNANGAGGSGSNGTGQGDGSGSSTQQDEDLSLVALEDYEEALKKLEKINKEAARQIPKLYIKSIIPEVYSATVYYQFSDPHNTHLGPTQIDVVNEANSEIVQTMYSNGDAGLEQLSNLKPNNTYHLSFTYQFDLGNGEGVQVVTVDSISFTTENVQAVYQLTHITSNEMTVNVKLDQQVSDLQHVRLYVQSENGESFYIEGNNELSHNSGETFVVSGLASTTAYNCQLELTLSSGEVLKMNESTYYRTLEGTTLNNLSLAFQANQQVAIDYDWQSTDYRLQQANIELKNAETSELIEYQTIAYNETGIIVVPKVETQAVALTADLRLDVVSAETGETEQLVYESDQTILYNKAAAMTLVSTEADWVTLPNPTLVSAVANNPTSEVTAVNETTNSTVQSSELPATETEPVVVNDQQPATYTCHFEWYGATDQHYLLVTERQVKTAFSVLNFEAENWQMYHQATVGQDEAGNIVNDFELPPSMVSQYYFRTCVYNQAGELIMYVYPN